MKHSEAEVDFEALHYEMQRDAAREIFAAKIGPSFGRRRYPRVRERKGTRVHFNVIGERRTKRAAFRAAREARDQKKTQNACHRRISSSQRPLGVCRFDSRFPFSETV